MVHLLDVCLLSSFDTQIQFIERLRKYFISSQNESDGEKKSLMLVQIELSHRYDNDLLSCVRHLTVETRKEMSATIKINPNARIAVIVIVPRENVRNVSGFQLGNNSFIPQLT